MSANVASFVHVAVAAAAIVVSTLIDTALILWTGCKVTGNSRKGMRDRGDVIILDFNNYSQISEPLKASSLE